MCVRACWHYFAFACCEWSLIVNLAEFCSGFLLIQFGSSYWICVNNAWKKKRYKPWKPTNFKLLSQTWETIRNWRTLKTKVNSYFYHLFNSLLKSYEFYFQNTASNMGYEEFQCVSAQNVSVPLHSWLLLILWHLFYVQLRLRFYSICSKTWFD